MPEQRWIPKFRAGMKVMHFKTGRTGTILKFVDEERIQIKFNAYNAAGIKDGRVEVRRKEVFVPAAVSPRLDIVELVS